MRKGLIYLSLGLGFLDFMFLISNILFIDTFCFCLSGGRLNPEQPLRERTWCSNSTQTPEKKRRRRMDRCGM